MQSSTHNFNKQIESHDFIKVEEENVLPFLGNGYISMTVEKDEKLYLRINKGAYLSIPINPLFDVLIDNYDYQENSYIDIKSGILQKISCFHITQHCSTINKQVYAHRNIQPLLIQKFILRNPTNIPVKMFLSKIKTYQWPESTYKEIGFDNDMKIGIQKTLFRNMEPVSTINLVIVLLMIPPQKITVAANSKWEYTHYTIIKNSSFSGNLKSNELNIKIQKEFKALVDNAQEELRNYMKTEVLLYNSHRITWNKFWKSGFGVSISKAKGELNGDKINSTLYYMISTTPYDENTKNIIFSNPENCYSGHHTRQNKNMWITPTSSVQLFTLIETWLTTLEKFGCGPLLNSGIEGVLQAMILSFGALKFTQRHLEYNIHPKELHRNYYFRNVKFLNISEVEISVTVGEDNKATLEVKTSSKFQGELYVCDAGCQDQVTLLTRDSFTKLPVILTDPLTPILYISQDKKHLEEMKGAIHFEKLAVADPHEQHIISYHKHGNHYGGLPTLFWASILLLIIIFHMFLFKLIYNEYCQDSGYIRLRYNL